LGGAPISFMVDVFRVGIFLAKVRTDVCGDAHHNCSESTEKFIQGVAVDITVHFSQQTFDIGDKQGNEVKSRIPIFLRRSFP
jgi:hypothetical protein